MVSEFLSIELEDGVKNLSRILEIRTGIIIHEVKSEGEIAVLIRDARGCKKPHQRGYEAFEMAMLNAVSTALDIIKLYQNRYKILHIAN